MKTSQSQKREQSKRSTIKPASTKPEVGTQKQVAVNLLLRILLGDAQHFAMQYAIIAETGQGKTYSATQYQLENDEVLLFRCNEETTGEQILSVFQSQGEMQLVVFDDAHKLTDKALCCIAKGSTGLGDKGIIMLGTPELARRIKSGVLSLCPHYQALYKLFGKKFITAHN